MAASSAVSLDATERFAAGLAGIEDLREKCPENDLWRENTLASAAVQFAQQLRGYHVADNTGEIGGAPGGDVAGITLQTGDTKRHNKPPFWG